MADLIERLRAHLDEDERVALAAGVMAGLDWSRMGGEDEIADHSERHDPARTLRWVAAARRLLDWLEAADERAADADWFGLNPDDAIAILASIYGEEPTTGGTT